MYARMQNNNNNSDDSDWDTTIASCTMCSSVLHSSFIAKQDRHLTFLTSPKCCVYRARLFLFTYLFLGSNAVVYDLTARDIVNDTAGGINGCYMAYGQTGCGKTHRY